MTILIVERAELLTIVSYFFLFVCCYCQPSSVDVTLLTDLDHLLDTYPSVSPVICGYFNGHKSCWLHSSHTSSASTATLDFCVCRGLHQLVNFPTQLNAILNLLLSETPGSTQALPNLNTPDHVAVLLTLPSFTKAIIPIDYQVYHWSSGPWQRLHH